MQFKKTILCSDIEVLREISGNKCNYVNKPDRVDSWIQEFNKFYRDCNSFKKTKYDNILERYSKKTISKEFFDKLS